MLGAIPVVPDDRVLVDFRHADDAGVYRWEAGPALVQTVDFFTPIVDDPFQFGQIAAANALSDIYAMGGRPLTALNIAAFPSKTLPLSILGQILAGGADKCREAGCTIVGGHTIDDPEPKYGLAVTGVIHPRRAITNAAARPGDVLVLTKPIGTGIISTGIKRELADARTVEGAVRTMTALNRSGAEAAQAVGVSAGTDVTGFGLLGHLLGMCRGSGVGAILYARHVPILAGVADLMKQEAIPGGTRRNLESVRGRVSFGRGITEEHELVLADAQTSGGLLLSVPRERAGRLVERLRATHALAWAEIGEIVADRESRIRVEL